MAQFYLGLNPTTLTAGANPQITVSGTVYDVLGNASGFSFQYPAGTANVRQKMIFAAIKNWNDGLPSGSAAFIYGSDKLTLVNPGLLIETVVDSFS